MVWLGPCTPVDLSRDGKTVLAKEGLWTAQTGWVPIPDLPGRMGANVPKVLSGDGHVVFGCSGGELYRFRPGLGTEGLGQCQGHSGLQRHVDEMATNLDGSLLFTCGYDEEILRAVRWNETNGFEGVVEFGLQTTPCAQGSASMSQNEATMVVDSDWGIQVASSGDYRFLREVGNIHDLVSAVSGDGRVIASYRPSSGGSTFDKDGPRTEACMSYDCDDSGFAVATDLNDDGNFGVGVQYATWLDWSLPPPQQEHPHAFFWSAQGGLVHPSDAFFDHGRNVDALLDAQLAISADGNALLGLGTRQGVQGATTECFLATLGPLRETAPPTPLLPASARCGDGTVDSDEECDDGNANDADGCTARCIRPALTLGARGTCRVRDQAVECWGSTPGKDGRAPADWSPGPVPGLAASVAVATYERHGCAIQQNGTVRCWGQNDFGQLGDGSLSASSTATDVLGLTSVAQIGVGSRHSCARLHGGEVWCWGANDSGQLGDGSFVDSPFPVLVPNLQNVSQIAATTEYTCALSTDAIVRCWGDLNGFGQAAVPTALASGDNARQVAVSPNVLCALTFDGAARCWHWLDDSAPSVVAVPESTTQIALGSDSLLWGIDDFNEFLCALSADGTVQCSGYNEYGQLGNGARARGGIFPAPGVVGIQNAISVTAGNVHACVELADRSVRCWGLDTSGQLGFGFAYTNYPSSLAKPVEVVNRR